MWVGKSFINLFSPDPKKMNQLYDSQPESSKFQSDLLPFKMETLTSASGCILGKAFLDLKDDWYSVPIYRYYIKLLRFEWKGHLWVDEFNALTNGLADTPRVVLGYSSQYLQLPGKQDILLFWWLTPYQILRMGVHSKCYRILCCNFLCRLYSQSPRNHSSRKHNFQ